MLLQNSEGRCVYITPMEALAECKGPVCCFQKPSSSRVQTEVFQSPKICSTAWGQASTCWGPSSSVCTLKESSPVTWCSRLRSKGRQVPVFGLSVFLQMNELMLKP